MPLDKAHLTQEEFDELLEYSTSVPTLSLGGNGSVLGTKRWKRRTGDHWLLGEYVVDAKTNEVTDKWSRIVVVGELEIDKTIAKWRERSGQTGP